MSKYNLDLDYVTPLIDISEEELNEIITEADKIIQENKESPENLAIAYLKKAQCQQKLEEYRELEEYKHGWKYNCRMDQLDGLLTICDNDMHESTKNLLDFEKALELSPNMPEALMQKGKYIGSRCDEESVNKALDMYTTAIQLKRDYAAAYNNRGLLNDMECFFWQPRNSFF